MSNIKRRILLGYILSRQTKDIPIDSNQAVYTDILTAQSDRLRGVIGRTGEEVLADMDAMIAALESYTER